MLTFKVGLFLCPYLNHKGGCLSPVGFALRSWITTVLFGDMGNDGRSCVQFIAEMPNNTVKWKIQFQSMVHPHLMGIV
jgi:hypothetical protein